MHKSQVLFMHTVKHSCSVKQLQPFNWPSTSFSALRCERFAVSTYFTEVRWEQHFLRLPYFGRELNILMICFENSRFRISCVIRFGCRRGGLGGERELLKWKREEKKTSYTFTTPHTDSRKELQCYLTTAEGFNGHVWHQTHINRLMQSNNNDIANTKRHTLVLLLSST